MASTPLNGRIAVTSLELEPVEPVSRSSRSRS